MPLRRCALLAACWLAACQGPTAGGSLDAARAHLARNEIEPALIQLKNALQAEPELAEARLLLGQALLERGDAAAALIELRKAEQAGVAQQTVLPLVARALLEAGEHRELLTLTGPEGLAGEAAASLHGSQAEAALAAGDTGAARASVEKALAAAPGHVQALRLQAQLTAAAGDRQGALGQAERLLATAPQDAGTLVLHAALLQATGQAQRATAAWRQAVERAPRSVPARTGLFEQLLGSGDLAQAREALAAFRKALPGHPQALLAAARLALAEGDPAAADEHAKQLLKAAPDSPPVLRLAGAVALRQGEPAQAEQHLGKLLRLQPEDAAARRMLAEAQIARGENARALDTLQPLTGPARRDAAALALSAQAHGNAGRPRDAERALVGALKIDPDNKRLRIALAERRLAAGGAKALAEFEALARRDGSGAADAAVAAALLERGQLDGALAAAERRVQRQGGSAEALEQLGRVQAARRDFAAARASFERALALAPTRWSLIELLVRLDIGEDRREAARERVAAVVKTQPGHAAALLLLASLDDAARRPRDEVAALLKRAVAAAPTDTAARARLVDFHLAARDAPAALAAAQDAAAALPDQPAALHLVARAETEAGQLVQAARSWSRLAAQLPAAAEPLIGLARTQWLAGEHAAALASAQRALDRSPRHPDAVRVGAQALQALGRGDAAAALARGLTLRQPDSGLAEELLGDIERERGSPSRAAEAYAAALRKLPGHGPLAIRRHGALQAAGQQAEAAAFAAQWRRERPRDAEFVVHLAASAIRAKDAATAEQLLDQALAVDPRHPGALNNLAWLRAQAGKPGAVELATRAVDSGGPHPQVLDTLALALASERRYTQAIETQQRALSLQPGEPGLRLTLARLYIAAGDKPAARRELEALAQLGDSFRGQSEVRALSSRL